MQDNSHSSMAAWLVLIVNVPSQPSSLRVRAWRKLRALGAVALKSSVYLLPFSADHQEQLQWLTQEVQKDGGDATLLKVDRVENVKPGDLIRLFQIARDDDYRRLADRYRKVLAGRKRGRTVSGAGRRRADEVARLAREVERVREIDFFDASGYREIERLSGILEQRLRPPGAGKAPRSATALSALQGRRWATRPRPHVDRIASAWLIKRFIDPHAEFVFAPPEEFPPDAVPFDVLGAEFGHHGQDCTFETLLKRAAHRDRRLTQLAEIVHEADLKDAKFRRDEARGLDLAIRGLAAAVKDDHELLASGIQLFDGLYATVGTRP